VTLEADLIVDRRRLRRKLGFWRAIGILTLIVALLVGGAVAAQRLNLLPGTGAHVARIAVSGFIAYDRPLIRAIDALAERADVRAVVLQIESPGGSTAGSEALHAAIRRVAARKPVVAVVGSVGASGAYIAAIGADHIVAAETSLVGSIGVIAQWPEVHELLRTLGIRFETVRTTPLKAAPSGLEPTTEEARAAMRALVGDSYRWFVDLVRTRRSIEGEALTTVTDGRVFTGRQALDLRLIDAMGDERTAVAWLERERGIARGLPLREYRPQRQNVPSFLGVAVNRAAEAIGIPRSWLPALEDGEPRLDGLLSVWHPAIGLQR